MSDVKETVGGTSGSSATDTIAKPDFVPMEWSVSASPHLHGSRPVRSYVIEVTVSSEVEEAPLQEAVDRVIERQPYYARTFVCRKGLYYDAQNDLPVTVAHKNGFRQLGTAEVNWHMMDVTYDGRVIFFAAAHALADGESFTNFVQSVLYYYFCAKDGIEYEAEGVVTADTPVAEDELVDPFAQKRKRYVGSMPGFIFTGNAKLPENKVAYPEDHRMRYPLHIPTEALLSWAKANNSAPAAAVSGLIAKAVGRENPKLRGKLAVCVQISMRRLLGVPHTLKNCVGVVFLHFDKKTVASTPAGELAAAARKELRANMTPEYTDQMAGMLSFSYHLGKHAPTKFLRNKLMSTMELCSFNTVSVDYAGHLMMGEYKSQVEQVSYYFSEVFQGSLYLIMSECAGKFLINFNQSFDTDRYYRAFLRVLDEEGIPYTELPPVRYLTPEVVQEHDK